MLYIPQNLYVCINKQIKLLASVVALYDVYIYIYVLWPKILMMSLIQNE